MTEVGFIIQPGQSIRAEVTEVRDRHGDRWIQLLDRQWRCIEVRGEPWDGTPISWQVLSGTHGPLTVTAVREQPAEPEQVDQLRALLLPIWQDFVFSDEEPDNAALARWASTLVEYHRRDARALKSAAIRTEQLRDEIERLKDQVGDQVLTIQQAEQAADEWASVARARGVELAATEQMLKVATAEPDPLVLPLPTVPDGTVALVGAKTGRRYEKRDGWWSWDDGATTYAGNLTALLDDEGSVTVVMAPPHKPRTTKDNIDELRNWINLAAEQKHWEYDEAIYCLDRIEAALTGVFDDKDSTE